jgi:hypothetical protein
VVLSAAEAFYGCKIPVGAPIFGARQECGGRGEVFRTRKLSTCLIRVTDAAGELVALLKGIAYLKATPLGTEAGH